VSSLESDLLARRIPHNRITDRGGREVLEHPEIGELYLGGTVKKS